jgi:hypothetical protein
MATRSKKTAPVVEELEDQELDDLLEEDDDAEEVDDIVEEPAKEDGPVERDTYTAKQIATRIGVDAKVLRKFFRSAASTVEPCGQGGRYEFDAADLPKIKAEFEKYSTTKKPRGRQAGEGSTTSKSKGRSAPASAAVIEEDDELLDLDELEEEPDDNELLELDDEETDVEDIDEGLDEEEDIEELDEDDDLEELDD